MSTLRSGSFRAAADSMAFEDSKKGVSKKTGRISIPWAATTPAASMLSRPPENTQRAFIPYSPNSARDFTRAFCLVLTFAGTSTAISA